MKNTLTWQGELSSGQKEASDAVIQAIEQKQKLLVWAVCIAEYENGEKSIRRPNQF
ncbi:hypothetical protein [Halalkalibacter krulwichiae]|uniref:hypothetical protein n=1 Tax=Halalkalibacter krulwichiae TaxID=199441 RepID=UPI0012EEBE62|nr:hypothetical protein [Halalkalibacter krulwichiae]